MKQTIQPTEPGQKSISFTPGGLHTTTSTPAGQKIPKTKIAAALAGKFGPKGKSQPLFAKNVLTGK
jgi:hypothetical protein